MKYKYKDHNEQTSRLSRAIYYLEPDPIEQLNGADDREASEETHVAANL